MCVCVCLNGAFLFRFSMSLRKFSRLISHNLHFLQLGALRIQDGPCGRARLHASHFGGVFNLNISAIYQVKKWNHKSDETHAYMHTEILTQN